MVRPTGNWEFQKRGDSGHSDLSGGSMVHKAELRPGEARARSGGARRGARSLARAFRFRRRSRPVRPADADTRCGADRRSGCCRRADRLVGGRFFAGRPAGSSGRGRRRDCFARAAGRRLGRPGELVERRSGPADGGSGGGPAGSGFAASAGPASAGARDRGSSGACDRASSNACDRASSNACDRASPGPGE
jgi:hypothetical protein